MMNNTTFISNIVCTLTTSQLSIILIIKEAVGVILAFLLFLLPFTTILVWLTFIGLIWIRNWRNTARKYYYAMASSNIMANAFGDIIFCGYVAFNYICLLWFNVSYPAFPLLNLFNLNIVFCRALSFLMDAAPTFEYWTTAVFVVHRTLVIIFPLHGKQINGLITYWVLIIPLLFSLIYSPSLFLSSIVPQTSYYSCVYARLIVGFWAKYYAIANAVAMFVTPIIIVIICNALTAIRLTINIKHRSQIITRSEQSLSRGEQRANLVMITISIAYICGTLPNAILTLITQFVAVSCDTQFIYTLLGGQYFLAIFIFLPQIIRFVESLTFILMIRELRNTLNRLCFSAALPFLSFSTSTTTREPHSTKEYTNTEQ